MLFLGFLPPQFADQKLTILEAGCGVGNCLFPLLEEDLNIFAYACDFSPRAVEYVKVGVIFGTSFRVFLETYTITSDGLPLPVYMKSRTELFDLHFSMLTCSITVIYVNECVEDSVSWERYYVSGYEIPAKFLRDGSFPCFLFFTFLI